MAILTYTFGVRFRKGFSKAMLVRQAGMDRYVHNQLLQTLKEEYHTTGNDQYKPRSHQRMVY